MLRTSLLTLVVLFFGVASAFAVDSYVIPTGGTTTINEHGACRVVTNSHASGSSIMVPTKTAAEWSTGANAFLTALPAGVTAPACDTTPNAFAFTDQTGVALSTLTTSNTLTISGINTPTSVLVSGGGSPKISINGGAWGTSGSINNGQSLRVQLTSSASGNTAVAATVTVGSVSDIWSVTTVSGCGGVNFGGYCWYLGSSGQSCNAACSTHGGFNAATDTFAGSQNWNTDAQGGYAGDTNCASILNLFGYAVGDRAWAERYDLNPPYQNLGCHVVLDATYGPFPFRSMSTIYDTSSSQFVSSSQSNLYRACACNN